MKTYQIVRKDNPNQRAQVQAHDAGQAWGFYRSRGPLSPRLRRRDYVVRRV